MSVFESLLQKLYQRCDFSFEEIKNNVSQKVDVFARQFLSEQAFQRYLEAAKNLKYQISYLPIYVTIYYDRFRNKIEALVSGVLGYYDMARNVIVLNRFTPREDIASVIAHERIHQATRDWAIEYFKMFGEYARPIVEGFTELVTRLLGYSTKAYNTYVKAAWETLRSIGYDLRAALYGVLNFHVRPEDVFRNFYRSLCYQK